MRYSKEIIVGVSLVVAALIFILGIRFFSDLPLFRGTYTLNTAFENANGLTEGSSVHVNGVRVGAVDAVQLDAAANQVRVEFHVDRAVAVPDGSEASLGGIAALASIHLNVHLGPPSNRRVEDGGFIPGRSGGGLLDMVTNKGPALAEQMDQMLLSANSTLEEAEVLLGSANSEVPQTLQAFRRAVMALENTLRAEQQTLHETLVNLESFSRDMSGFSGTSADTLALAVDGLNRSMRQLELSLQRLEGTTQTLDEILNKINTGDGTMARLINDPSVYAQLDSSLASMNRILSEFETNPRKFLEHLRLVDLF